MIVGALERSQGFVQHDLTKNAARFFPGGGTYVHPFKEIGIARIGLDLGLGCRARQRQGRLDLTGNVLKLDQLADLAKVGQVLVTEIEHGDPVPEGPAVNIKDDLFVLGCGHGSQPLESIGLVKLDTQSLRGLDDLLQFLLMCSAVLRHVLSPLDCMPGCTKRADYPVSESLAARLE